MNLCLLSFHLLFGTKMFIQAVLKYTIDICYPVIDRVDRHTVKKTIDDLKVFISISGFLNHKPQFTRHNYTCDNRFTYFPEP